MMKMYGTGIGRGLSGVSACHTNMKTQVWTLAPMYISELSKHGDPQDLLADHQ